MPSVKKITWQICPRLLQDNRNLPQSRIPDLDDQALCGEAGGTPRSVFCQLHLHHHAREQPCISWRCPVAIVWLHSKIDILTLVPDHSHQLILLQRWKMWTMQRSLAGFCQISQPLTRWINVGPSILNFLLDFDWYWSFFRSNLVVPLNISVSTNQCM